MADILSMLSVEIMGKGFVGMKGFLETSDGMIDGIVGKPVF
jgi:hypothetical protein